jgi:hypothetical protein
VLGDANQIQSKGDLGFQDLHIFNLAMLASQACQVLLFLDTLCAQVRRVKYFPCKTILEAKTRDDISYTWRSILKE